jgi:predicted secreted Zn-dependent protease
MQHLFLFLLFPLIAVQGQNDEDLIQWTASRKLTWADYKARPDKNSDAAASTTTTIAVSYNMKEGSFSYAITCKFSRDLSWGLHKTDYILSHEQGHFDIAEIIARKLNKALGEYQFNKKTYQKDLSKIYNTLMKEKEDMQNTYDRETNHSIKKKEQAAWLEKIATLLDELDEFATYH